MNVLAPRGSVRAGVNYLHWAYFGRVEPFVHPAYYSYTWVLEIRVHSTVRRYHYTFKPVLPRVGCADCGPLRYIMLGLFGNEKTHYVFATRQPAAAFPSRIEKRQSEKVG